MSKGNYQARWERQRGTRPVRVANCSGYKADPGYHMRRQAELGDVDFITGDYLAGIEQTVDLLAEKRIKVIINGGAHNPKGLAEKTQELGLSLKVAYVAGDNLLPIMKDIKKDGLPPHLDSDNSEVRVAKNTLALLEGESRPVISANAYLGAREIVKGLELGADIIIAGRVADASPVIGAAWYWHSWSDTDYDRLAGALIAGHSIECSAYVTGSNFAGFYEYPLDQLYDLVFGIAEIESDGTCVITKHKNTKGMVTADVVKCQFLYELQGNIYLNSDVKGILDDVKIEEVGRDRVRVCGIRGAPPPPTTKLAIFYRGGYQSEILVNATGYATTEKWDLYERMMRFGLKRRGILDKIGIPQANPQSQLQSTTYMRIFAEASDPSINIGLAQTMSEFAMQHFSGFHNSMDQRCALPRPYLSYYPALYPQASLQTSLHLLHPDSAPSKHPTTPPPHLAPLGTRASYDADPASTRPLSSFGPTRAARLGDVVLARSGDKSGNANIGFFVPSRYLSPTHASSDPTTAPSPVSAPEPAAPSLAWAWLRAFLTRAALVDLLGADWDPAYHVERVEFAGIGAVHFVVYGILGRGVSGSARLDGLGKGLADYLRDKVVEVPVELLDGGGGVGRERAGL
ncbi:DUF1446-domain-containing protein [Glonium stellatum]|uniref:DUF1446-domain-containing protein n=1 Tax=Glonium stellatum TaxID=574774 RepID=A0A8E2F500_9PEZI|nr:DUF1446-domain-containing protein [Glonium stellatum]